MIVEMVVTGLIGIQLLLLLSLLAGCTEGFRHSPKVRRQGTSHLGQRGAVSLAASAAIRPLGGYERLLSRLTPGTSTLSLSHAASYLLNRNVEQNATVEAAAASIARHPMLRAYVEDNAVTTRKQWMECDGSPIALAAQCVRTIEVDSEENFTAEWQRLHYEALNFASFGQCAPQWRLDNIVLRAESDGSEGKSAWVFCVNHGIDDQRSINIVVDEMLAFLNKASIPRNIYKFPDAIEDAIAPGPPTPSTLFWALYQTWNSLHFPAMIPKRVVEACRESPEGHKDFLDPDRRRTVCRFFRLPADATSRLVELMRDRNEIAKVSNEEKFTVTNLLSAVVLVVTNTVIQGLQYGDMPTATNLRFLLSVGLRPFGAASTAGVDFTGGTVACVAGAVDFIVSMGKSIATASKTMADKDSDGFQRMEISDEFVKELWALVDQCRVNGLRIIRDWKLVPESVRLFGFGMDSPIDILKAVEIDAASSASMGRGFSCGVSNMGVVSYPSSSSGESMKDTKEPLSVSEAYYATSHGRNGVLCLLSCMTIDGQLCACLQMPAPLISESDADYISDRIQHLLKCVR